MKSASCLGLGSFLLVLGSLFICIANANIVDHSELSNTTVRSDKWYEPDRFLEAFDNGNEGLLKNHWFSGYWGNGQPFNVGRDPCHFNINR